MARVKRVQFIITIFTASGAKIMIKRYEAMGFKHISLTHDIKKNMYINTFK